MWVKVQNFKKSFRNSKFITCRMPIKIINFKFNRLIVFKLSENLSEKLSKSAKCSMLWESQPQNPEFRINPENFHP